MYVLYGTALNIEIEILLQSCDKLSVTEICEKLKQKHGYEASENNLRRRIRRALDELEQHQKIEKKFIKSKTSWFPIPVYKIKSNE